MNYLAAVHSDRGIRKKTNQDSVLYKEATTDYGKIVFAVVCDGMGGLANGEIASASLIQAFSRTNRIYKTNKKFGQIVTFQAPILFKKSVAAYRISPLGWVQTFYNAFSHLPTLSKFRFGQSRQWFSLLGISRD